MTKIYTLQPGQIKWIQGEAKDFHDLQKLVGGYIESVPLAAPVTLYCNEEGKVNALPPTAIWLYEGKPYDLLVGPLVLIGPPDEDGSDTDATPEMLSTVEDIVRPVGPDFPIPQWMKKR